MQVPALRRSLLRWYGRNARDLPWRRTRDPYAIWVSEVMLQQTRVDVAVPYYERWMRDFPTVAALAAAPEQEVLRRWAGLGYYSRARNLHRAARQLVEAARGASAAGLPRTAEALRGLPGVGDYTSAAIASIAFGEPAAVVDGNVERVVARLLAIGGDPRAAANRRRIRQAAQEWLDPRRAGDWNQAMMDLGATVCVPVSPRCGDCPVAKLCKARMAGAQHRIPTPRARAKPKAERRHFALVEREGHVLLVRNPGKGLLAGMWMLPGGDAGHPLAGLVEEQAGLKVALDGLRASATHQFSHRTWAMELRRAVLAPGAGRNGLKEGAAWVPRESLAQEAVPTAMRTLLREAGIGGKGRPAPSVAKAPGRKSKSAAPSSETR